MNIILIVHEFFPNYYTGTARVCLNLAEQLRKMGHKITIITYEPSESNIFNYKSINNILWHEDIYKDIKIIRIKYKNQNQNLNFEIFNDEYDETAFNMIFNNIINDIDIIHILHPLRMGNIIRFFISKQKYPIILTLTDAWLICPRVCLFKIDYSICNNFEIKNCIECGYKEIDIKKRIFDSKFLINSIDYMIFPSKLLETIFKKNKLIINNYKIINHGLDYKYFKINLSKKFNIKNINLGYVGPILRNKGLHILIQTFKKIKNQNIYLKIYGETFDEYYMSLIKRLYGKDKRIKFYGKYDYNEISNIYSNIDIAIFPSTCYESYSLSLIEALAHKVPVIASNTIGASWEFIKNGQNGYIFESGDVFDLYNKLVNIIENPKLIEEFKENIIIPPRIEEEAFYYEILYKYYLSKKNDFNNNT